MRPMPCPHARYHRTICPDCNVTNEVVERPQLEIDQPRWDQDIVEDRKAPPAGTVIHIDI